MLRRATPLLLALVVSAACERVEPPPPAPPAEFVVAAADSVFWIRSDAEGIRVRGAPLTLAFNDGRFSELYVTDDDHSFYDAVYVGQRLYKRDLITGDSMQVFADTLMRLLARAYASANPDEVPLARDEQGSENPRTIASAEILVLDVMGPWVSYEYRTDVDVIGGRSSHGLRRGVLDLRTGVTTTLEALVGRTEARRLTAEGQRQWRQLRDSLLVAAPEDLELREQMDGLAFDPRSYALQVQGQAPLVRFTLAQTGARLAAPAQHLVPLHIEAPAWWEGLRPGYAADGERGERIWPREGYTLVARAAEGERPRVAVALRDEGGQEWRLGFVPAPVLRVMWLEDSTVAPGTREALTRAFNDASLYSENTRIVRHAPRARPGTPSRFHRAAFSPRPPVPVRRHPPARSRS